MRSHTPPRCQSRRRRQHVIPDPHPSSCGSICQGMPLRRTNRMPVRHARSETRGRPPFGRRGGVGKNGSTRSHNGSAAHSARQSEPRGTGNVRRRRLSRCAACRRCGCCFCEYTNPGVDRSPGEAAEPSRDFCTAACIPGRRSPSRTPRYCPGVAALKCSSM
jgi:hypothetical protein